ncbi:hypothetical protein ACLB2K_023711 [Fragaria x ananassa]
MTATSSGTATKVACPWAFMCPLDESSPPESHIPKAKTFASVLSASTESSVPITQLPIPVVRGDKTYVKINEALYQEQLKNFKTNLIGRLLLRKGSTPLKTSALKQLLNDLWKPVAPWRLVPLGKGYFDIHFTIVDDLRRVWGRGTCSLANGLFRLAQWKPDFVPGEDLPYTHAQLWVRLYGLSQDYWHPQHLMEIARGVGTPLQLDRATIEREFGYYARVLVDVDVASDLPSSLMVERETHCFPIEVVYENMCTRCRIVGHTSNRCRQLNSDKEPRNIGEKLLIAPQNVSRQEYRVKTTSKFQELAEPTMTTNHAIESVALSNEDNHVITPIVPEVIDGAANDLIVEIADRVINETSDQSLVDSVIVGIVSHATPSVSSPQQIRLRKDTHEDIVAPTRSANDDNVSTNNSFEILAQVQQESLVGLHSNTLVDNEDSALGELPVKRVCWGDLENEEPLGHTHYVSSTEINYETWYHENETTSDERLLCALPKPQHKKVKAKQYQSSSRYPARNRTPPVRLDL